MTLLVAVMIGVVVEIVASTTGEHGKTAAQTELTATSYHEEIPSPALWSATDSNHSMPLPSAQDRATQVSMTNAGIAMIQASQSMEAAAAVMIASGDSALVGSYWYQDALVLPDQGVWMIVTATSNSIIRDLNKARELDPANLEVNGMGMEAEGEAMANHSRAMLAQVDQLRTDGSLSSTISDDLTDRGNLLITTGNEIASDGKQMQEYTENLQRPMGE